jgi:short-subunit dehydrogenase
VRILAHVSQHTNGTLDVLVNNAGNGSFGVVSGAINTIGGRGPALGRSARCV